MYEAHFFIEALLVDEELADQIQYMWESRVINDELLLSHGF